MSQNDKLIARFKRIPSDFTYDETVKLLKIFGYKEECNDGSRRSFVHTKDFDIIYLHEPHPESIMKSYALKQIKKHLEERRYL